MNSHEQYKSCFNKTVHFTPHSKTKLKFKITTIVRVIENSRKLKIPKNYQNSFKNRKKFRIHFHRWYFKHTMNQPKNVVCTVKWVVGGENDRRKCLFWSRIEMTDTRLPVLWPIYLNLFRWFFGIQCGFGEKKSEGFEQFFSPYIEIGYRL